MLTDAGMDVLVLGLSLGSCRISVLTILRPIEGPAAAAAGAAPSDICDMTEVPTFRVDPPSEVPTFGLTHLPPSRSAAAAVGPTAASGRDKKMNNQKRKRAVLIRTKESRADFIICL